MSLCFSFSYLLPNEFPHADNKIVLYCIVLIKRTYANLKMSPWWSLCALY